MLIKLKQNADIIDSRYWPTLDFSFKPPKTNVSATNYGDNLFYANHLPGKCPPPLGQNEKKGGESRK